MGHVPTLKGFFWNSADLNEPRILSFLYQNPQLEKVAVGLPADSNFLDTKLLPILIPSFTRLKSLSLCWSRASVPEASLAAISAISTLEQLEICATDLRSFQAWPIDHELLRTHLRRLIRLRRLAFINDAYQPFAPDATVNGYYGQ